MQSLRDTAKSKPIEFLASITMILCGVALPLLAADSGLIVGIGTSLAALGGALLSWSNANANSVETAAEILRPQLEMTTDHLAALSGQIQRNTDDALHGTKDPDTAIDLIRENNYSLLSLVSNLQRISGSVYSGDHIVETAKRMSDVTAQILHIYSAPSIEDPSHELQSRLSTLRELKRELDSSVVEFKSPKGLPPITVKCDECDESVTWPLGEEGGSSAKPQCKHCGNRFNLHRREDKSFFTVPEPETSGLQGDRSSYERILRDQGLRLVPARWRRTAMHALCNVFDSADGELAGGWEDLDRLISNDLKAAGEIADLYLTKHARQLGYRCKIYSLQGDNRLRLADDINSSTINFHIDVNLCQRILSTVGDQQEIDRKKLRDIIDPDLNPDDEYLTKVIEGASIQSPHTQPEPTRSGG